MLKIVSIVALALLATSCASIDNALNAPAQSSAQTMSASYAQKGLITKQSSHSAKNTADKLESLIKDKGLTLFTRVDHQRNAANADLKLTPTEVIIFGNPKAGTPLMQCAPSVAIDLPQKMLISQDAQGRVWLTYNSTDYLKERHNIQGCDQVLSKISALLDNLSTAATSK
ncbi:DUF302 domain-containing protein [uncultured Psychrobacter sp.]|uniref:DUF302 domain-containing protein n=1 Tax=uncultured Psychrobacter sp. TaxID=259303 RepID=UPI0034587525